MRYLLLLGLLGCASSPPVGRCVSVSDETLDALATTKSALKLDDEHYAAAVTHLGREDDVRSWVTVETGAAQSRVAKSGSAEDATIVRHGLSWLQVHRAR